MSKVPSQFRNFIKGKTCLPTYDILTEDKTLYNVPGWHPLPVNTTFSTTKQFDQLCPKPWRFSSFRATQSLPYMGNGILYSGGGFVADLGYNKTTALYITSHLESNRWMDDNTAVIFVEFTLFNPTTMLFTSVKLLLEKAPYGATNTYDRIDTFGVYSRTNKTFLQACQFLLTLLILVIIGMETKAILIERTRYFKNLWNILQWFQIGTVIASIAISYLKESYTSTFLKRIKQNPFKTSTSDYIVLWTDMETILLSFVIFILTIKLLRIICFNQFIGDLVACLKSAKRMAGPLSALFIILMVALSIMANMLFGYSSYDFSTYTRSLSKMIQLLAGGTLFQKEIYFENSSFGLVFGILYPITTTVFLVNVFVSVLIDSLKEIHKDVRNNDSLDPMKEIKSWIRELFHSGKKRMKNKTKCSADKYEHSQMNGNIGNITNVRNESMETVVVWNRSTENSFKETHL